MWRPRFWNSPPNGRKMRWTRKMQRYSSGKASRHERWPALLTVVGGRRHFFPSIWITEAHPVQLMMYSQCCKFRNNLRSCFRATWVCSQRLTQGKMLAEVRWINRMCRWAQQRALCRLIRARPPKPDMGVYQNYAMHDLIVPTDP